MRCWHEQDREQQCGLGRQLGPAKAAMPSGNPAKPPHPVAATTRLHGPAAPGTSLGAGQAVHATSALFAGCRAHAQRHRVQCMESPEWVPDGPMHSGSLRPATTPQSPLPGEPRPRACSTPASNPAPLTPCNPHGAASRGGGCRCIRRRRCCCRQHSHVTARGA